MKKVLGIMAVVAMSALMFSSCAKKCSCTRYEDGKAVVVTTSNETKYFDKSICTSGSSEKPYEDYSWVTEGKKVTVEYKCK
ncbi:MAG: hypothetical protein J5644_05590 [Bacteroidales bacterium]|nr:hypothetical protein [Bacteroidales bacterium]